MNLKNFTMIVLLVAILLAGVLIVTTFQTYQNAQTPVHSGSIALRGHKPTEEEQKRIHQEPSYSHRSPQFEYYKPN